MSGAEKSGLTGSPASAAFVDAPKTKGVQPVLTCAWADKSKTLCTNPLCIEKAGGGN
jgi:hypothetical protein